MASATNDFIGDRQGNQGLVSPASHFAAVTPSDSADLTYTARALLITTAGNLKITSLGGETDTISVPVGVLPIMVTRVWSTGTTATGITAMW